MTISTEILTKLRENDPTLVHLDLTDQQLTDDDILPLGEALTHNTHLKSLNLNKNKIGLLGITTLAPIKLETLSISQNELSSDCIDALILSETLTSLDVSGNNLTDADIVKIASYPRLTSVDVSDNIVGPLSMTAFGLNNTLIKLSIKTTRFKDDEYGNRYMNLTPLRLNTTLKCLEICANKIFAFDALSGHPELEALNIEGCNIGYNKVEDMRPISLIPKLSWLNIRRTESYHRDTDLIAKFLANLPLLYLDISETEMSALGAKALARSTTLITLIASKNYIGIYGLAALAKNKNITHLNISENNFKRTSYMDSSRCDLYQKNWGEQWHGIKRSKSGEQSMSMDESRIREERANLALKQAFEQNTTWRVLNMSNSHNPFEYYITDETLANFIKNNTTLLSLDISHFAYNIGTDVLDGLAANRSLRAITFTCNLHQQENRNALSKNLTLTTIKCSKTINASAPDPFPQTIQERNRDIISMRLLLLRAMTLKNNAPNHRILDDSYLILYISAFLMPEHACVKMARYTSIYSNSIFSKTTERAPKECESNQNGKIPHL